MQDAFVTDGAGHLMVVAVLGVVAAAVPAADPSPTALARYAVRRVAPTALARDSQRHGDGYTEERKAQRKDVPG
jgi:hypothetical protein